MNTGKVCWGIPLLLAMAFFAPPARAQSESEKKQEAKEHYEKATRFYDLAKYGDAIREYEEAYLLVADPNLLYNMGQAYRLWDKPEEAIRCYKNYLRNRADASNRADVERKIAELERTVEDHRKSGTASLAPPPPAVQPGSVAAEGESPPANPGQAAGTLVESGPLRPDKPSRVLPYTLLSAGGACLVTSLVTGLVAANKAKQIADASKQPSHPVFDPSVQSTGKAFNAVAIITGVTGLAAGGVGLYLYYRYHRASRASATAASTPSQTEVAFFPLTGPGFAGGGASVNF
jgi:tetratricopeptide (TPR) repeat protein